MKIVGLKNYVLLFFCCWILDSCTLLLPNCFDDPSDHPDNEKYVPTNKSVHIQNNTDIDYKNNGIYCVSLRQEVKTGKYLLLFYSLAKKLSWLRLDYTLSDIDQKTSTIKKWSSNDKYNRGFYDMWLVYDKSSYIAVPSEKIFKNTGTIFYLLYLNAGKRKVFFGQTRWDTELSLDKYDESPRKDGVCYHEKRYLDIFVKDTKITLEKDSASSNHKVVNPLFRLNNGEKVNLATLPIKQVFIKYDDDDNQYDLVRIVDFK